MVCVYLQCAGRFYLVCTFYHCSAISERLARRWVILALGLEKRSGRPEQWPKIPQKYDLIRKNRPF